MIIAHVSIEVFDPGLKSEPDSVNTGCPGVLAILGYRQANGVHTALPVLANLQPLSGDFTQEGFDGFGMESSAWKQMLKTAQSREK